MQENRTDTLPAEVHTVEPLSTHVKRPKAYIWIDRLFPNAPHPPYRRALAVGALVVVAVVGVLLWRWGGLTPSGSEGDFQGGLPVLSQTTENETDGETNETAESDGADMPPETTAPTEPTPDTDAVTSPDDSEETLPPEPPTAQESEASTQDPSEDTEDTTEPPAETESREPVSETESTTEPEPETVPVPDGCFPITSADLSEVLRGAGYILNEGVALPSALPTDSPWRVEKPAVLIVNTHPYEGYHDGSAWYDPAEGDLAQTDSTSAPDGVVALGVALTRALRDRGVTVIHLRLPTTAEESSADLYDRTEAMIRYYCRLYPDVGLVIDLRRSAELIEGGILRTEGSVDGEACAQLRITVNGGRDAEAAGYDLAVALALRESLWEASPTVSRPVRVRSGSGLVPDLGELRVLTFEMGAAGNTYAEAEGLVPPLAEALNAILQDFG